MKPEEDFKKSAGDIKIIATAAEKDMYSHDIGDVPHIMTQTFFQTQPDFVVQPQSIEEIARVLSYAFERKIPVIPRGAALLSTCRLFATFLNLIRPTKL